MSKQNALRLVREFRQLPARTKIVAIVTTLALVNFAVYLVLGSRLGGEAPSGKVTSGHYYVRHSIAKRTGGGGDLDYSEVSRTAFNTSLVVSYLFYAFLLLAMFYGYAECFKDERAFKAKGVAASEAAGKKEAP